MNYNKLGDVGTLFPTFPIISSGLLSEGEKVLDARQRKVSMYQYNTDVEILVNGRPVKQYAHNGRTFIEAKKGSSYSIKVRNNGIFRRLFVVSVDGINVIDGKPAGSSNAGYVINGYSSYEVSGFRTSNEEVHPFKFNDKQRSYAAKSDETGGDTSSCGVIGIQVYEEIIELPSIQFPIINRPTWNPSPTTWGSPHWSSTTDGCLSRELVGSNITFNCNLSNLQNSEAQRVQTENTLRCSNFSEPSYACCVDMAMDTEVQSFSAGTEFSKDAKQDRVSDTEFEIGGLLTTIEIFYDYRDGLLNMGVPVTKEAKVVFPSAFPARFCKPPKD